MDDMTKKLLAKCDSSFPGERVNALDLLYDHLQKIGQKFSDLVHEFEQAIPAQKYADLEQLYNNAVKDNTAWAQRYSEQEKLLDSTARQLAIYKHACRIKANWHALASALAGATVLLAAAVFGYQRWTAVPWPDRGDADLRGIASNVTWGLSFDQPFIVTLAGRPYWLLLRGEVDASSYVDGSGRHVVMRCLHVFAAPADAASGQYRAPNPYGLFGFGWLQWPERYAACQKSPDQSLAQR